MYKKTEKIRADVTEIACRFFHLVSNITTKLLRQNRPLWRFPISHENHLIKRCFSLWHSEIINRAVEDLLVVLHQPSDQQSLLHLRFSIPNPHRFVIPRFHFCIDSPPFLLIFRTFVFPRLCDCFCRGQLTRSASHLLPCHDV